MILNIYRSCIYYDPVVFNYVRQCRERSSDSFTGFQDIKIWYAQFDESDPYLTVNDMTIRELEAPIIANEINFWKVSNPNDEHYLCALHSLTFSGEGAPVMALAMVMSMTQASAVPAATSMTALA